MVVNIWFLYSILSKYDYLLPFNCQFTTGYFVRYSDQSQISTDVWQLHSRVTASSLTGTKTNQPSDTPYRLQKCLQLVFNPVSSLFLSSLLLISFIILLFLLLSTSACPVWLMPVPGDHLSRRHLDHHWLHSGGLHHVGLRWLLLYWGEPQHGGPARIPSQQQLHGLPERCECRCDYC